jgi:hypothetical protein
MAEFDHCFEPAAAAAGWDRQGDRPNTDRKLAAAFRAVRSRMGENIDNGMTPRDAALRAGREAAEMARVGGQMERRTQLLNLSKRIRQTEHAIALANALADKGSRDPIADALHSMLDGSNTVTVEGGERASTAAKQHANASGLQGSYEYDLRNAKLLGAVRHMKRGSDFERNIYRELYELSRQDSGEPAQVGRTGDQVALKVAQIARKYQVQLRSLLNAEGADIGDYAGYMGRTIHGADPIYRAGFDTWSRDILAGLDPRTFAGMDTPAQARMLRDLFAAFTTGRHMEDGQGVGMADPEFSGPANLAKRLSQGRVLHWKDADAWIDYQNKYAPGSFQERIIDSLRRGARQHALLMDWGTNPRAEFENLTQRVQDHFQQVGRLDTVRAFVPTHKQRLMSLFSDLDGHNDIPLRAMGAKIATYARTLASMADLGGVLFRHASAMATVPAELHYGGVSYLSAVRQTLLNFLNVFPDAERQRVASLIGAGVESLHGAALSANVGASDSLPGIGDKLLNTYVRLTGLTPVLRAQKEGVAMMLAHELALDKASRFADLSPARQAIFHRYGITPADWDALRAAPDLPRDRAGREYLTPDAAARSPAKLPDRERTALGLKLRAYYVDSADRALITPTATDRNIARFGLNRDPNTIGGQVGRFLAQFHTWPIAAARQGLGREWNGRRGMNRICGLLSLALTTTAAAYAGDTLNGLLQSKEPAPVTPETFVNSFVRGGASGLLGDYLMAAARNGVSGVERELAGPVATDTALPLGEMLAGAWRQAKTGDGSKLDKATALFLRHNIPFANLFYARGALHYLLLDSLQETLNPGYLERANQYAREQDGPGYMSPWPGPENHLPVFGR